MLPFRFLALLLLIASACPSKAVEIVTGTNSYFNTTDNISLTLPGWTSGWGSGGDGWNYVGQVNGNTYNATGISYSSFTNSNTGSTNADLTLFNVSTTSTTGNTLSLSALTLSGNAPAPFSQFQSGSTNVMIGYGGGSRSWGINTVTANNTLVPVNGFYSVDYVTAHGTITAGHGPGTTSITNNAELIVGDSGGGNFIKLADSWQLAGINEAIDGNGNSYLVQLGSYSTQISVIVHAVPEPGTCFLLGFGLAAVALPLRRMRRRN